MNKNRIRGLRRRASEQLIAKPTSIKLTGGKSGGCASKAVELGENKRPCGINGPPGFLTFLARRHNSFPPLMSLSGQSASQERKFSALDRVNHDRLLTAVAERVADKRMLKLIRAFLEAGGMEDGWVSPVDEGTPQGGPLSPWLSNLVLDELDRELERRGHRFVRYADDSAPRRRGEENVR
jgi:hypothetical protein